MGNLRENLTAQLDLEILGIDRGWLQRLGKNDSHLVQVHGHASGPGSRRTGGDGGQIRVDDERGRRVERNLLIPLAIDGAAHPNIHPSGRHLRADGQTPVPGISRELQGFKGIALAAHHCGDRRLDRCVHAGVLVEQTEGQGHSLADAQFLAVERVLGHLWRHCVDDETTRRAPGRTREPVVHRLHRPVVRAAGQTAQLPEQTVAGVARAQRRVPRKHAVAFGLGTHPHVVGQTQRSVIEFIDPLLPAEQHHVGRICGSYDPRLFRRTIGVELGVQIVVDRSVRHQTRIPVGRAARRKQIQIAVPVVVGQGNSAEIHPFEGQDIVQGKTCIGILVHPQDLSLAIVAGDDQIHILVVVVVAPGQVASPDARQFDVGQRAQLSVFTIDVDDRAEPVGADAAGDQVQIAIPVVVTPGQVAGYQAGQAQLGIHQLTHIIAIYAQLAAARAAAPGHGQVQIPVPVVVAPGQFAVVQPQQFLIGLRK